MIAKPFLFVPDAYKSTKPICLRDISLSIVISFLKVSTFQQSHRKPAFSWYDGDCL